MTDPHLNALRTDGAVLVSQIVPRATVEGWRVAAEARYAVVDELVAKGGPWGVAATLGVPFVPTASSLGLTALGSGAEAIVVEIRRAVGALMEALLGSPTRPLLESAWLRRQFAPARAPAHHAPHALHQDGALGFDYLNDVDLVGGLLPMVTCWCPLVPCGQLAPGMAYRPGRPGALLSLDALGNFTGTMTAPVMKPGDILMLMGDVLHRTHVAPAMTKDRISVEVRFVPAAHPGRRGPWSAPTK